LQATHVVGPKAAIASTELVRIGYELHNLLASEWHPPKPPKLPVVEYA